jgi:hypothetical protein
MVIDEVISESGKSKTATLERLLYGIEQLAKHGELPKTIGLDFFSAAITVNARGHGAKHLDPVHIDGGEHVDFDAKLLERSGKSKSGFAGVNGTGTAFRAFVPDVLSGGGTRYLPSRPTAMRAAIDRYEWFQKYGIPYGNVGWHVEEAAKLNPEKSVEQHLVELLDFVSSGAHGLRNPVTAADVEMTLANHRKANGIEVKLVVEDERPRTNFTSDVVLCAVCDEEIRDGEPFGPYGKSADFAHSSCIR